MGKKIYYVDPDGEDRRLDKVLALLDNIRKEKAGVKKRKVSISKLSGKVQPKDNDQ